MTAATEGITSRSHCGSSSSSSLFPYKHCNETMIHLSLSPYIYIYIYIYIYEYIYIYIWANALSLGQGHLHPCLSPFQLHEKLEGNV